MRRGDDGTGIHGKRAIVGRQAPVIRLLMSRTRAAIHARLRRAAADLRTPRRRERVRALRCARSDYAVAITNQGAQTRAGFGIRGRLGSSASGSSTAMPMRSSRASTANAARVHRIRRGDVARRCRRAGVHAHRDFGPAPGHRRRVPRPRPRARIRRRRRRRRRARHASRFAWMAAMASASTPTATW